MGTVPPPHLRMDEASLPQCLISDVIGRFDNNTTGQTHPQLPLHSPETPLHPVIPRHSPGTETVRVVPLGQGHRLARDGTRLPVLIWGGWGASVARSSSWFEVPFYSHGDLPTTDLPTPKEIDAPHCSTCSHLDSVGISARRSPMTTSSSWHAVLRKLWVDEG